MKIGKLEIDVYRQGNFITALLLIYFVFFGFICNIYLKDIGEELLFLYQILFNPATILSLFFLVAIVFVMTVREHFFEYALRNSIWLTPFIILMSWFWYWFLNGFNLLFIPLYFVRLEGYLTILSILAINFFTAVVASVIKEKYNRYIEKIKRIRPYRKKI